LLKGSFEKIIVEVSEFLELVKPFRASEISKLRNDSNFIVKVTEEVKFWMTYMIEECAKVNYTFDIIKKMCKKV
jgi:hypothetical protein